MQGINLEYYYRIATITSSLNSFIREAQITKTQLNTSMQIPYPSSKGIGNRVDILA